MQSEAYRLNHYHETSHWWFLARQEIILSQIKQLQQNSAFPTQDAMILDYGCGTGGLTQALSPLGTVHGVDFSDEALNYCRKRGLQSVQKIEQAQDIVSHHYDLITSFDVLEHIADDVQLIHQWHRMLKDNGLLFITVPAYQWLWGGEDVVSNHQRRYDRRQLVERVEHTGFEVLRCTYFNTFLFPLIATHRLCNRVLNPNSMKRSDVKATSPLINTILYQVFGMERYCLRYFNFPFGISLLLVAKKRVESTL